VESLAFKLARRECADPFRASRILCGVRVIVHNLDDVALLEDAVARELGAVVESDDVSTRLGVKEFGYLSRHVLLRSRPGSLGGSR